jgi:hypothetical protein
MADLLPAVANWGLAEMFLKSGGVESCVEDIIPLQFPGVSTESIPQTRQKYFSLFNSFKVQHRVSCFK